MKPILFEKTATDFTSLGIARLPDCISCLVTEERNGIYELEMVYPVSGRYFSEILEDRIISVVPHDGGTKQAFRIYRITTPINGEVTINARHISYQMNFIPVGAVSGTNKTAAQMMAALKGAALEACPFSFSSDISTKTAYNISLPASMKASLGGMAGSVLDLYGGEYEWDNWNVILHRARGSDRGVRITYGKNLTDLTKTTDIGDTITGVAAYYSGLDESGSPVVVYSDPLVISNSNVSDYAHARTVPLDLSASFETVPTSAQVTAAATAYLAATTLAQASEAVSVDFVALWQSPEYKDYAPLERVNLCDIVYVGYKQLGVSVKKKVTKTVYNVILDRYDTIELGGEATLADTLANMDGELTGTIKDVTALEKVINGKVSKAGDTMTGDLRFVDKEIIIDNTQYSAHEAPSSSKYKLIKWRDKLAATFASIAGGILSNGRSALRLMSVTNGNENSLYMYSEPDGTAGIQVTKPAAWRSALGAVNIAGDTMTGDLTISKNGTPTFTQKHEAADTTAATDTATRYWTIAHYDKNSKYAAYWQTSFSTSGRVDTSFSARRVVSGSNVDNKLVLRIAADGTRSVAVTEQAPWRAALGLGTSGALPITIAQGGTGQTAAVDACQSLLARPWKNVGSIKSDGTASATITFSATSRGLLYINGTNANRTGIYMFYASSSAVYLTPIVAAGANITITQNANKLTIANASTSAAWCIMEFFDKTYYSAATVS